MVQFVVVGIWAIFRVVEGGKCRAKTCVSVNPTQGCIHGNSQVIGVSSMKTWLPIKVPPVVSCTAQFEGVRLPFLGVGAKCPSATPRRSRQEICRRRVSCHFVIGHGCQANHQDQVDLQGVGCWNAIFWSPDEPSAATSGVEDKSTCHTWLGCSTTRSAGSTRVVH